MTMLRTFSLGRRVGGSFLWHQLQKRTFLSESYICQEQWKKRLQSPTLGSIKPSYISSSIDRRLRNDRIISAVDVDVFANVISDEYSAEELLTFLQELRMSKEAFNILDSTHQAVIMFLLEHDFIEELLYILHNRLTFGIFPNHYNYNTMMDLFVMKNEFANAAKVAVLPMLQDDEGNLITKTLALYSCCKYLENPAEWVVEAEEDDGEEVKVRIPYLRNPYNDDHFDIQEPVVLVGKTLAFYGRYFHDAVGRSCQLWGLVLYKKYKKALNLLLDWRKTIKDGMIYLDVVKRITEHITNIPEEQQDDDIKQFKVELDKLEESRLLTDNLIDALQKNVEYAVQECSTADIEAQEQLFKSWEQNRQDLLDKQTAEISKQNRLKHIEELKKGLEKKETLLTFFENEEQIELQIETKEAQRQKLYDKVASKPKNLRKLQKLEAAEREGDTAN